MKWRIVYIEGLGYKVQSKGYFTWSDWERPYMYGYVSNAYFKTVIEAEEYLEACKLSKLKQNPPKGVVIKEYN